MFFWNVGATIWIFRYVFRDPGVDLRALALGAILPDLIDKPLALLIAPETLGSDRIYAHTLVFALLVMTAGILGTRRGTVARKRAVAFTVGILVHLLLDGLWTTPELLFWPVFGFEFPSRGIETVAELAAEVFTDPIVLALEAAGIAYLAWLAWAGGLARAERRAALIRTGRLSDD
jgi:hypothetical protein